MKHFVSDYNPFIINRGLSYFPDTIQHANEMNANANLDAICQYDFYFHFIPKRKRFAKWSKKVSDDRVDLIMEYYKCNRTRALEYVKLLSDENLDEIKQRMVKGG